MDEVLGLELFNLARSLKLRSGVDRDHVLVKQVANNLRQVDYSSNPQGRTVRRNLTSAEEDLMALAMRIRPHTNS